MGLIIPAQQIFESFITKEMHWHLLFDHKMTINRPEKEIF